MHLFGPSKAQRAAKARWDRQVADSQAAQLGWAKKEIARDPSHSIAREILRLHRADR